jgi:hypothetical protein
MSRGVEAPLALTAIAVAVGNGWIEAMWNWIYTTTHTGGTTTQNPLNKSGAAGQTPFTNPTTGQPVGSSTYNPAGGTQNIIPNNPQTNPMYS